MDDLADAVRCTGLTKRFGTTTALDGLDLRVPAGAVVGFLGPNGAGKSTTIRILLGLVRPDAGQARLFGTDVAVAGPAAHRRLAYVPGDVAVWPRLTGGQAIDALLGLRGVAADPAVRRRREELLERFRLDPSKRCRSYSKGNRQKVALVAAFAAPVELLVLDEPTTGLDPLMAEEFRTCVREARDAGSAVLLSSHALDEVESLCDEIAVVRAGRLVESGSLAALRHLSATTVEAELPDGAVVDAAALGALPGVDGVELEDGPPRVLRCHVGPAATAAVLAVLAAAGTTRLVSRPPSLEELFLRYYGDGDS
ncbi:MAG: ABC transporter ATP-binding protein [Kineosporiaceae bacterium]